MTTPGVESFVLRGGESWRSPWSSYRWLRDNDPVHRVDVAGVSRAESEMVLGFVRQHIADVSLHCRWQWQAGDLAIWDERSTLHRAAADHFPQRRIIRRLEIDGDRPTSTPTARKAQAETLSVQA